MGAMGHPGPPAGFEWDDEKAASNAAKHGVTFVDGAAALSRPQAYTNPEPRRVGGELRDVTFAPGEDGRLLAVVHTRRGDNVRIISVRRADRQERRRYVAATGGPTR